VIVSTWAGRREGLFDDNSQRTLYIPNQIVMKLTSMLVAETRDHPMRPPTKVEFSPRPRGNTKSSALNVTKNDRMN